MKIKMKGSELKKVDIEFLSLVKRGANRAPFKVIKAEDGGVATAKTGLIAGVQKFFQMSEPAAKVVAVFVEKTALAKAAPNLADAGFQLDAYEVQDDCVVFKQDGFDNAREVIMVKSEATIGFAVANVGKFADVFCGSLSFDPSVADTGFYPGPNEAMKAMQVAINVEKQDTSPVLDAFHAYSRQISKALPESIAKFEAAQRGFGEIGSGTTDSSEVAKAASAIAETILKDAHPGRAGVKENAKKQTQSSDQMENGNSTTSTSELPGTEDDSPDDEAQRKAAMAKAAASTTTSTTEDDKMSKAQAASTTTEASTTSTTTSEDGQYNFQKGQKPVVIKEGGKEFWLAVSKTGEVIKYTAGAKIPEGHTTMTMPWDQDGALGGTNNGNGQGQGKAADPDTKADNELRHTGAGGDAGNMNGTTAAGSLKKEDLDALMTLPGLVTKLAESIAAQGEVLKTQSTRLEAVEKTAAGAVKKADEKAVVVITPNYDSAYDNLGGVRRTVSKGDRRSAEQIRKAEFPESVWEGALGALESHIPGVESV